jgi:hypothetical protein
VQGPQQMWTKIDILNFKVPIHNEDGEKVKHYLNKIIISFFMFISLFAQRNEPKKGQPIT